MLKQLPLVGFLLLLSACQPVSELDSVNGFNTLVPLCITSQSQCQVNTELANFSIKFSQQQLSDNVKTELPFLIELTELAETVQSEQVTKQSITNISAYLEGKDMFMGKVPVFFEQSGKEGVYSAQSLLASCSEEHMDWRMWITIELKGQEQTFFVDFTSQRL
ncbi:MAG: hypothetical protein MJK15_16860 [Colwellia sp.]|nr:hypothetical protein [Colwellia sp.]